MSWGVVENGSQGVELFRGKRAQHMSQTAEVAQPTAKSERFKGPAEIAAELADITERPEICGPEECLDAGGVAFEHGRDDSVHIELPVLNFGGAILGDGFDGREHVCRDETYRAGEKVEGVKILPNGVFGRFAEAWGVPVGLEVDGPQRERLIKKRRIAGQNEVGVGSKGFHEELHGFADVGFDQHVKSLQVPVECRIFWERVAQFVDERAQKAVEGLYGRHCGV